MPQRIVAARHRLHGGRHAAQVVPVDGRQELAVDAVEIDRGQGEEGERHRRGAAAAGEREAGDQQREAGGDAQVGAEEIARKARPQRHRAGGHAARDREEQRGARDAAEARRVAARRVEAERRDDGEEPVHDQEKLLRMPRRAQQRQVGDRPAVAGQRVAAGQGEKADAERGPQPRAHAVEPRRGGDREQRPEVQAQRPRRVGEVALPERGRLVERTARVDVVARQQEGEHAERPQREAHDALEIEPVDARRVEQVLGRRQQLRRAQRDAERVGGDAGERRPARATVRRAGGARATSATKSTCSKKKTSGMPPRSVSARPPAVATSQIARGSRAPRVEGEQRPRQPRGRLHGVAHVVEGDEQPAEAEQQAAERRRFAADVAPAQQRVHADDRERVMDGERGVVAERQGQQAQHPVERVVHRRQRIGGERLAEHLERRPQRRPVQLREQPHHPIEREQDRVLVAEDGDAPLEQQVAVEEERERHQRRRQRRGRPPSAPPPRHGQRFDHRDR